MPLSKEMIGEVQVVTRQLAALQQIEIAIALFKQKHFACAITLALAAEDQLPDTAEPYLFRLMREKAPEATVEFNFTRNWLKHYKGPEKLDLTEFEVAISIARAVTKFVAVHKQSTNKIEEFIEWTRQRGYLSK